MASDKIKLAQVVALDSGERTEVKRVLTDLHHKSAKSDLFSGTRRTFTPTRDDVDQLPPEAKKVQLTADSVLAELRTTLTNWWDHVLTKDSGNRTVPGTLVCGDFSLDEMPLPTLLWLEGQLNDIRKFVDSLPILDPAYDWKLDPNEGVFKTEPTKKYTTRKVPKVIVKYDATPEHPAQTELVHIDENVGYWDTTLLSGAIDGSKKRAMLDRIAKLQEATKMAREEVNTQSIQQRKFAGKLFDYILGT